MRFAKGKIVLTLGCCVTACSEASGGDPQLWHALSPAGEVMAGGPPPAGGFGGMPASPQAGTTSAGGSVVPGSGGQDFGAGSGGAPVGPGQGGFPGVAAGGFMSVASGGSGIAGSPIASGGTIDMGVGGTPAAGGAMVDPTPRQCSFTLDVTTVSYRGRYSPNHIMAIWITDPSNRFIKTLAVWGVSFRNYLRNAVDWVAASQSNTVDAVTAATRRAHGPVTANWDCTDVSGQPVTPGSYQVCMELEENDVIPLFGTVPHTTCVPFDTSSGSIDMTAQGSSEFTQVRITMQ